MAEEASPAWIELAVNQLTEANFRVEAAARGLSL
jgi:hypothetical protein